ncbi:MAG: F0F1 ATP synthase subunit epsilon [Alphaproteobacteria bacterium]|nr:F0F1 ATP synthase subunit epsilon [Alphaproteobacteria bacterium]
MTDKIAFDLVSPERLLLSENAEMITLPGAEGYLGVLAGHEPLITVLRAGVIDVKGGDKGDARFFVLSGFAEVNPGKLTVLAEEAIPMEHIDAAALDKRIANAREDILTAKTDADRAKAVIVVDDLETLRAAI